MAPDCWHSKCGRSTSEESDDCGKLHYVRDGVNDAIYVDKSDVCMIEVAFVTGRTGSVEVMDFGSSPREIGLLYRGW